MKNILFFLGRPRPNPLGWGHDQTSSAVDRRNVPGNYDPVPAAAVGEPGFNLRAGKDGRHNIPEPHNDERHAERDGELLYPRQASHRESTSYASRPGNDSSMSVPMSLTSCTCSVLKLLVTFYKRRLGSDGIRILFHMFTYAVPCAHTSPFWRILLLSSKRKPRPFPLSVLSSRATVGGKSSLSCCFFYLGTTLVGAQG